MVCMKFVPRHFEACRLIWHLTSTGQHHHLSMNCQHSGTVSLHHLSLSSQPDPCRQIAHFGHVHLDQCQQALSILILGSEVDHPVMRLVMTADLG